MNPMLLLSVLCVCNPMMFNCGGIHLYDVRIPIKADSAIWNPAPIHLADIDAFSQLRHEFKDPNGKDGNGNTSDLYSETAIHFYVDGLSLEDEITIDRPKDLKVQVEGSSIKEVKLYIDDQLQDVKWSHGQTVLRMVPKEQSIIVVVEDMAGNRREEKRMIHQKKEIEFTLSVTDDAYTLDPNISLRFEESPGSEYMVVLEQNGQQQTFACPDEKSMSIRLGHSGKYTIYVQRKADSNTASPKHTFYFTNEAPNIRLVRDGDKVRVFTDGDWIQEKKLLFNGTVIPWTPVIDCSTPSGHEQTISLVGSVKDLFGQTSQSELLVHIDRKPPIVTMWINDQLVNNAFTMDSYESAQIQMDENGTIACAYFKNGRPFPANSLQEALASLMPSDVLQIHVLATDSSDNQSTSIYTISRAQLLKEVWAETKRKQDEKNKQQPVSVTLKTYFSDTRSIQYRTWSFDSNQHLRFTQKQMETQAAQPSIRILIYKGKQKRIRILLEKDQKKSRFIFIRVNGKKISLRKLKTDPLGNTYYQFDMKDNKVHMKIQARNLSGNVSNLDRTILNKGTDKNGNPYRKIIDHW